MYGLSTSSGVGDNGPDGDKDGDGVSNFDEFKAGTNPADANDHLKVSIQPVAGGVRVDWSAVPDVNYQLETAEELVPVEWKEKGGLRTAISTTESDTDYSVGTVTSRFYRVKVK